MHRPENAESGYALVTAILAVAALSSLLVSLQLAAKESRSFVAADLQSLREEAAVDSAIHRVLSGLSHPNDPLWQTVQIDGPPAIWMFDGRRIALNVSNTRSKIDLNTASELQFGSGLAAATFADERSAAAVRSLWIQARAAGRPLTDVSEIVPPGLRYFGLLDAMEMHFTTSVPGSSQGGSVSSDANAPVLEITAGIQDEANEQRRRRRAIVLLPGVDASVQIVSWRNLNPRITTAAQR